MLLGTFLGDTGAYIGGRTFGTRRLAPRISPNKTSEGLIAGVVIATFAVWWYGLGSDWMGGTKGALLGLTVGIAAPISLYVPCLAQSSCLSNNAESRSLVSIWSRGPAA